MRNANKCGQTEGRRHFKERAVDGRIILKWIEENGITECLTTQLAQIIKLFTSKNGLREARNLSPRRPIISPMEILHHYYHLFVNWFNYLCRCTVKWKVTYKVPFETSISWWWWWWWWWYCSFSSAFYLSVWCYNKGISYYKRQDYNVGPGRTKDRIMGGVILRYERRRTAPRCGNACIRLLNCCYFILTLLPCSQSLGYKP